MAIRKLKPTTPGQRFRIAPVFDKITADKPEKSLISSVKRSGGRNNTGKMTVRNVGGGHKKRLRDVDFKEISLTFQLRSNRSNTIRTGRRA